MPKFPLGDKSVEGEEVDFATIDEEWNTYALKDGSRIKLKAVVLKVVRTKEYNEDGDPIYIVKSRNLVDVQAADHLKRPDAG
jgi:hypothetical protein